MTNHPIAEQDSLEGLIARLLEGADHHDEIRQHEYTPAMREAADTLSQMRDALVAVRRQASLNGKGSNLCRLIIETVDAALTTTKIEKE